MSESKLPTPSLDEIKTWDEHGVFRHFQHTALGLKHDHVVILREEETSGAALILLTETDLLSPPFNLRGGPVKIIMNEIARLKGTGSQQESTKDLAWSTLEARIRNVEVEIELVAKNIKSTADEKEKDRLCKERTELREKECLLLELQKEQLRAPSSELVSIVQDIKHDTENLKLDTEDLKLDTRGILSSLDELHSKVDSLPKVMLDLLEDTVPRLFFIFPEDGHWWEPSIDSLFTKAFRLYFLCEHETIENGSTRKHFHLAYHKGYRVTRPRAFIAKYGAYIRMIMPCLMLAVRLGGRILECVPTFGRPAAAVLRTGGDVAFSARRAIKSSIFTDNELQICTQTEKFFKTVGSDLGASDNQVKKYETDAPLLAEPALMERPDLRELQAYLEGLDNAKRLGNLQRVLRRGENGSITVRWVCKNHASEWDTTNAVRNLQTAIKNSSTDGRVEFDDETWELSINGLSRGAFRTFRNSVTRALSSVPLRKISIVACEKADSQDVEALINASTTIEMLVLKNTKNIWINNIIRRCPQLHHVILSVCNIDNKGASILAEVLKMNTSLQKLNLKDNNVGEKGASALAEALKMNENIETLDLEDNSIGAKGASTLAEALKMNTILQNLVLRRRTDYGKAIGDKGAKALAEALKKNTSLQILDLYNNDIGDDGASAIAETLKMNTSLQTLYLGDNGIGEKGASALAKALKMNKSLQNLYLEGRVDATLKITTCTVESEALMFHEGPHFGGKFMGDNGARTLAEALKMNTSLQNLDLSYNNISEEGASALAEALKTNASLQNLNLKANGIGRKGADALTRALKMNTRVKIVI